MTEVPQPPKPATPAAPAVPAGRSIDELKRDPLVARACERAGDAIISAKELVGEISRTVARDRLGGVAKAPAPAVVVMPDSEIKEAAAPEEVPDEEIN